MFIKKWWLNIPYFRKDDGEVIEITGWLNTVHDCQDKNDIPKKISGKLFLKRDEGGNRSFALLDHSLLDSEEWQKSNFKPSIEHEQYTKLSFVLAGTRFKIDNGVFDPKFLERDVLKRFYIEDLRIEDFVVPEYTYWERY